MKMSSTDSKKQANLSRIRTNQRLSRARRKEYISSLESRIREHEEKGVQATLEIQLAARKVAEENQRLRELLGKVGVSEAGIREYLQQPPSQTPCRREEQQKDAEPNECSMAADLISHITGANTSQVRVTLGCAPGRNCDVDEEAIEKTITRLKGSTSN
ncbi:hypothetical protein QC763_304730 [Podospora pseudopauciseta]|uniref:BZIP domain-containing protein n=2 Tax=Podospora TaxID=5144 RepID=A0ABR0HGG7_9PEZI|nr:hypothetical protein QC763_304730 [Podospora pseudopauciseta]KAK4678119.1 hypothetical protein QC764_304730 [Podospora pseudoanserina]